MCTDCYCKSNISNRELKYLESTSHQTLIATMHAAPIARFITTCRASSPRSSRENTQKSCLSGHLFAILFRNSLVRPELLASIKLLRKGRFCSMRTFERLRRSNSARKGKARGIFVFLQNRENTCTEYSPLG